MTSVFGGSLIGGTLLDPTQPIGGGGPADGVAPTDGATDPSPGISGAMDNVSSLAHTAQQSGSGADAQNINSDGSLSTATTPPPEPTA